VAIYRFTSSQLISVIGCVYNLYTAAYLKF